MHWLFQLVKLKSRLSFIWHQGFSCWHQPRMDLTLKGHCSRIWFIQGIHPKQINHQMSHWDSSNTKWLDGPVFWPSWANELKLSAMTSMRIFSERVTKLNSFRAMLIWLVINRLQRKPVSLQRRMSCLFVFLFSWNQVARSLARWFALRRQRPI